MLDVVSHVSHEALGRLNLQAGGCVSISAEEMQQLLSLPEVGNDTVRYTRHYKISLSANVWAHNCSLTPMYPVIQSSRRFGGQRRKVLGWTEPVAYPLVHSQLHRNGG